MGAVWRQRGLQPAAAHVCNRSFHVPLCQLLGDLGAMTCPWSVCVCGVGVLICCLGQRSPDSGLSEESGCCMTFQPQGRGVEDITHPETAVSLQAPCCLLLEGLAPCFLSALCVAFLGLFPRLVPSPRRCAPCSMPGVSNVCSLLKLGLKVCRREH